MNNKRFLSKRMIIILLLILSSLHLSGNLEFTRNNSYQLLPGIDSTTYRLYAYEYTVYQLSLQMNTQIMELIEKEPGRIRRQIDIDVTDLLYLIPYILDFEINKETVTQTHLSLSIKVTVDEDRVIENLLTIPEERIELIRNYHQNLYAEMRLLNLIINDMIKQDSTTDTITLSEIDNRLQRINFEHQLFLGDLEYQTANWHNALEYFYTALDINPFVSDVYRRLYETYTHLDEKTKTIEALKNFLSLEPDNEEALYLLGKKLETAGDIGQASGYYQRLIAIDPSQTEVAYFLTQYYRNSGDDGKAREYALLTATSELRPSGVDVGLAALLIEYELFNEAKPLLQQMLYEEPDNPLLYRLFGKIAFKNNQYHLAIIHYQQAVKLEPENFEALIHLGNSLFAINSYSEAIVYYQQALSLDEEYGEAFFKLANAIFKVGNYQEAKDQYLRAIILDFTAPEVYFNLGNTYYMLKNYENSIIYYQAAIDKKPDYVTAMFNLAHNYEELDDWTSALELYERILEIDSLYHKVYYNIANYEKKEGNLETAVEYYLKSIEIYEPDDYAYSNMGDCLRMLGRYPEAEIAYLRAIEINPDNPVPYNNLSLTYYLQEDYVNSLEYLRKAAKLGHYNASKILKEFK